jgi:hypothetical protein
MEQCPKVDGAVKSGCLYDQTCPKDVPLQNYAKTSEGTSNNICSS